MNLYLCYPLVTCFTIVIVSKFNHVHAGADDDKMGKSDAEAIGRIICEPSDKHDDNWFKCIECCQSINCYTLKEPTECNREARGAFCSKKDLNKETRNKVCVQQPTYNLVLKDKVIHLKKDLKPQCATDKGMKDLFTDKIRCFKACAKFDFGNPAIKKYCPSYKG